MKDFEEDYFSEVYLGNYQRRNPPYKWNSFLKAITRYKPEGRLLDVGCATGLFLKQASGFYECDGCDVSTFALDQARSQLPEQVTLYNSSVDQIAGHDVYDVITCFDVVEHIPDLEVSWNHLWRLLKPDGYLTITVPVYDGPLGWLVKRLDKDPTHVHRYNRGYWLRQVEQRFSLQYYAGIWRYFFFNRFYFNWMTLKMRTWTTAIFLIAKK